MQSIAAPAVNFVAILPETVLSLFAMALLLLNVFIPSPSEQKGYLGYLSFVGIAVTFFFIIVGWNVPPELQGGFSGAVMQDRFALFFKGIFLVAAALSVLITDQYMHREECNHGELYPLILLATAGMMLMASGTDLMTIFLGLELLSVSLYVLAGFNRANMKSNEAGLKYLLLGAFSTSFLLYGMALTYGATGTTKVAGIAQYIALHGQVTENPMLLYGMLLLAVGFSFKIAAVPFHMWTPDVYEGAPTPMTAFMSVGPKAAGFAAFVRLFTIAFPAMKPDWTPLLWGLAVLTMTVGNVIGLYQNNIKRMLAYSSIAHAGYVLIGFTAGNTEGVAGILFYMLTYAFMNIGAFAIVILVGRKGEDNVEVKDYAGLAYKHPLLAACMAIFLLSLAGLPPTAGFVGKFYLFSGAIKGGFFWLAIIGVLNSVISVYYYLRVTIFMYMKRPEEEFDWLTITPPIVLSLSLAVIGVIVPGVVPGYILSLAQSAIR
jgi:NADH-quinone oxidoreductase subunit N